MMEEGEHLEEAEEEAHEEETSEETDKPKPKQEFILHYERLCRGESNRVCTARSGPCPNVISELSSSSTEAQKGAFFGGKNPLSDTSANAGLRKGSARLCAFTHFESHSGFIKRTFKPLQKRQVSRH